MVPSPLREARLRRFVIVDDENHEDQLHCNASMAITTFNSNLFEKSSCKLSSSLRSIQSSGPRSPSGRRSKARSEIGIFLDRLFPHGTFLDGSLVSAPDAARFTFCNADRRCSIEASQRQTLTEHLVARMSSRLRPRHEIIWSFQGATLSGTTRPSSTRRSRHRWMQRHAAQKHPIHCPAAPARAAQTAMRTARERRLQPGAKVRCADREERRQRILSSG